MEAWRELQISFNLAVFGFYKQAFMSLRSGFELGLLSIYYNIDDNGPVNIKKWLKSKDSKEANTPYSPQIKKILLLNKNIKEFDKKFNFIEEFNKLNFLHNYIHTKGYKYSNYLGTHKPNHQTFEPEIFLDWIKTYEKIIINIITLHLLRYPISVIKFDWNKKVGIDNPYPVLDIHEIEKIEKILPIEHIKIFRTIAKKDKETQDLFNHIKNLPDLTENEKESQIINFEKEMIKHYVGGFSSWKKQQINYAKRYNKKDQKIALKRIKKLENWAKDENII